jgi:hypothetical protein
MEQCFKDCRAMDRRLVDLEQRPPLGAHQRSSLESLKLSRDSADSIGFALASSRLSPGKNVQREAQLDIGSYLQELRDIKEVAWTAELTCNRLAEDSLNRISACEDLLRNLERTVKDSLRVREAHVAKEELIALDRRLSEKLSEACTRLGNVVRTSSDNARNLSTEVAGLARRTKSLERSFEVKRTSGGHAKLLSQTSSPNFKGLRGDDLEGLEEPVRASSAPRAKTPPKKRAVKAEEAPAKPLTPPRKAVELKKSATPPKKSTKSKALTPKRSLEPVKEPSTKRSLTPKGGRTPRSKQKKKKSPSPTHTALSPATLKSRARDDAIKEKFKKTEKRPEKRPEKTDRRSRLEQLYQKLSAKGD